MGSELGEGEGEALMGVKDGEDAMLVRLETLEKKEWGGGGMGRMGGCGQDLGTLGLWRCCISEWL